MFSYYIYFFQLLFISMWLVSCSSLWLLDYRLHQMYGDSYVVILYIRDWKAYEKLSGGLHWQRPGGSFLHRDMGLPDTGIFRTFLWDYSISMKKCLISSTWCVLGPKQQLMTLSSFIPDLYFYKIFLKTLILWLSNNYKLKCKKKYFWRVGSDDTCS
jgi:hypothetical protein